MDSTDRYAKAENILNDMPQTMKPPCSTEIVGMEFPCEIDVKIFIPNQSALAQSMECFIRDHLAENALIEIRSRASSGSKYLAMTARVNAQNKEHIDCFYQALFDHPDVIMTI